MAETVLFEPPFPMQTIVGLGVVVLLLALTSYRFADVPVRTRVALVLLRALILAGIVLVLCRPMAVKPRPDSADKAVLAVLVDSSASMNTPDESRQSPRARAVAAALESARGTFHEELARRYQVNFYEFSEDLAPATLDELVARESASGTKTDIASALVGALNAGQD